MAIFNEILVGRFNRYLQKLTGIKGGPPTPALGTEIAGTFDLNSFPQEDRVLLGIDSFWQVFSIGPTAGQNSASQLRNPSTSNVLAVVEFVGFWESVVDTAAPGIQLSFTNLQGADLPTSNTARAIDNRSSRVSSSCVVSVGTSVAAFNTVVMLTVPQVTANSFFGLQLYEAMEFPLLPGAAIRVNTTVLNTHLEVSWKWRERSLEDSEKQLGS